MLMLTIQIVHKISICLLYHAFDYLLVLLQYVIFILYKYIYISFDLSEFQIQFLKLHVCVLKSIQLIR